MAIDGHYLVDHLGLNRRLMMMVGQSVGEGL